MRTPPPERPRRKRGPKRATVAILSRKRALHSTRRLIEAAKQRGLRPRVIDVLRCSLVLEPSGPKLWIGKDELRGVSVAIPRIGASVTPAGLRVVRQLEEQGVAVLNRAQAIADSRDKLCCLQMLASARVEIPRTVLAGKGADVATLLAQVGGLPAILKLPRGTQGVGVMIAHSRAEAESMLATLWDLGQEVLLQQYIAESGGADLRALVVAGRVVAAMRRQARSGEFRSNIHRGAQGSGVSLDPQVQALAVRAAGVLGLEVAGVDLLEGRDGALVMEVNSSPGLQGIEAATGADVAGAMLDRALELSAGRKPREVGP